MSIATMSSAFLFAANSAHNVASLSGVIGVGDVDTVFFNQQTDWIWNEIPDGPAACNTLANFRSRNIEPTGELSEAVLCAFLATVEYDELHLPPQIFDAVPGMKLRQMIAADEIHQLAAGKLPPDFFHGIHRVARACAVKFAVIEHKTGFLGNGRLHHGSTDFSRGGRAVKLVRRDGGRKENNTIEAQ